MPRIPETSTTLLRDVTSSSQHARWAEFHARYEPVMRSFLQTRFPSVDADDVIQEVFVALAKALPDYKYNPKENGHFHNYLTGIVRNKALKELEARDRAAKIKERAAKELSLLGPSHEDELQSWRKSIYEIALQQFLSDESVHERTKQVFVRLTIDGEKPAAIATSLGITRASVDSMKARATARLRTMVESLKHI